MIREERKQKKNKEHFIHIGPKLKAAREFSSLNLNCDWVKVTGVFYYQNFVSGINHGEKIKGIWHRKEKYNGANS